MSGEKFLVLQNTMNKFTHKTDECNEVGFPPWAEPDELAYGIDTLDVPDEPEGKTGRKKKYYKQWNKF